MLLYLLLALALPVIYGESSVLFTNSGIIYDMENDYVS